MKLNEHSATVAIVGAGPCGLALGLQLVQRGIACAIFEKNPSLSTHPKAMGMSRRSAEIFRQLGVLDALYEPCRHLVEGPDVCFNIFARSLVGEEWGRIPLTEPVSPLSPGASFHCPQTLTEKVLFDMLERTSPDCVHFNQKVTAVTAQEKQVEFSVGGERWTADWLIAADGAGGQIRRDLQVESDGPGEIGRFLNVQTAPWFPTERSQFLATILSTTTFPTRGPGPELRMSFWKTDAPSSISSVRDSHCLPLKRLHLRPRSWDSDFSRSRPGLLPVPIGPDSCIVSVSTRIDRPRA